MSPSTPPFSCAPLILGLAAERVDVEVTRDRDLPVGLDPLGGEPDDLSNGLPEVLQRIFPVSTPPGVTLARSRVSSSRGRRSRTE